VPQPPTFRVHDKRDGPEPIACDFVFATRALADRVRRIEVNTQTEASDHQPVLVSFAA
jgi:endonuclease/exonuclease/phosphatase family metal-dependent hydrolase